MPTIRCPIVLSDNKKVAELQDFDYKLSSNREAEFTSEGYLAHSDGNVMTGLTCGCIVPTAGISVDFIGALLNAKNISIGVPIDGKYHSISMVVLNGAYKGDTKSNTLKGSFDLEGGPPKVVG